jgi:hypothetical protein
MKKSVLGEKMRKLAAQTRDNNAVQALKDVPLEHVAGGKGPKP